MSGNDPQDSVRSMPSDLAHNPGSAPGKPTTIGSTVRGPLVVLGVALGGFIDGILFHQILQWHHVVDDAPGSPTYEGLRTHILADGLFHAAMWSALVIGLALLARYVRHGAEVPAPKATIGLLMMGWSGFNLVEGIVNHHILELHRVRPLSADPWIYDAAFLAVGALLLVAGWVLSRTSTSEES